MGAFRGVSAFFHNQLVDLARNLGYAEHNILILQGDMQALEARYPQTYANLRSCRHHADNRSSLAYAQDLVASWLFEDYFVTTFSTDACMIRLAGADRERQLLPNSRVSTGSDYEVCDAAGHTRRMELMNDYQGFWARTGKMHLRDNKYNQLRRSRSLFVAIDTLGYRFTLLDFGQEVPATYIPSHRFYGGKPAYELSIRVEEMLPLQPAEVETAILQHMDAR